MFVRRALTVVSLVAILGASLASEAEASVRVQCRVFLQGWGPCQTVATVTASPPSISPGSPVNLAGTVSVGAASTLTVELDLLDANQHLAWNKQWAGEVFAANQTRTYTASWTPAVAGSYSATIRLLDGSGTLVQSRDSLATISVVVAAATATATPTATPTSTPTRTATSSPTSTIVSTPSPSPTLPPGTISVTVDRSHTLGTNQLTMGVTHTQYSLDSWGDPTAVSSATGLLRASARYQNQHIMGWGALNPEPSPGQYDWSTLDARVQMMQSNGVTPVITLCCAPDWMKGGATGTTDWSQIEVAPQSQHFADFAQLAQAVARRYPAVTHYQVWNELKGFWNASLNRWDYEGYTALYNQVYDALKAVNPGIQVGGPYVVTDNRPGHIGSSNFGNPTLSGPYGSIDPRALDVITYWLANKHGGDFVTVDGMPTENEPFSSTQAFADVDAWIHQKTALPIWWAEWYATPWGGVEYSDAEQNAVLTDALFQMARSGASVALRWQPQATPGRDDESVWTDTRVAGGGQPFPFYHSARAIYDDVPPGAALNPASSSSSALQVLATASHTLLINTQAASAAVVVNGGPLISVPAYGVSFQ